MSTSLGEDGYIEITQKIYSREYKASYDSPLVVSEPCKVLPLHNTQCLHLSAETFHAAPRVANVVKLGFALASF